MPGVQLQPPAGQSTPPTALSPALTSDFAVNIAGQKLAWLTVMPRVKPALTSGTHCAMVQSGSAQSTRPSQSLSTPSKQPSPVSATGMQVRSAGVGARSAGPARSSPLPLARIVEAAEVVALLRADVERDHLARGLERLRGLTDADHRAGDERVDLDGDDVAARIAVRELHHDVAAGLPGGVWQRRLHRRGAVDGQRHLEAVGGGAGVVERDRHQQRVAAAAAHFGRAAERAQRPERHGRRDSRHWQHTVLALLKVSGLAKVTDSVQPPTSLAPSRPLLQMSPDLGCAVPLQLLESKKLTPAAPQPALPQLHEQVRLSLYEAYQVAPLG